MRALYLGAVALTLAACGDGGGATKDPDPTGPDVGATGGTGETDAGVAPDGNTGGTPAPDAAAGGTLVPDAATGGTPVPDAQLPDAQLPDAAPPPHLASPQGNVYLYDPVTDEGMTTQVDLPESTDFYGRLTNPSVQVFNCLKEPGGVTATPFANIKVTLCHEVQDTRADADGSYLSIVPPADETDGNDQFAGIMMYRNVTRVHDYFKSTHGVDWLDYALPAIVNLQIKIEPPISFGGFVPGPNGWYDFPNAAFFPKESWDALAAQFGLPSRDSDSIIFGQAQGDFSYDASVIMHEYTHAVIGTGRLNSLAFDQYGLDNAPPSMNEGLADYFAASVADLAVVGRYGIGKFDPSLVRDLGDIRRCPDDLVNEVHADGKVISTATWAIRTALGAEKADRIVFGALEQFGQQTALEDAGALLLAATREVDPDSEEVVHQILVDHGVIGCERAKPWVDFLAAASRDFVPVLVEGHQTIGDPGFTSVPGYNQWYVDLEPGTAGVTLTWAMDMGASVPGFGGGGAGDINLALRAGTPIEMGYAQTFFYHADRDIDVGAPVQNDAGLMEQNVTLPAGCLPAEGGRLYIAMLNTSDSAANITSMTVHTYAAGDVIPGDAPGLATCDPLP